MKCKPYSEITVEIQTQLKTVKITSNIFAVYRKVANNKLSRLVAHLRIFRLFIKEKFDAYVLWPLAKKIQNWIVDRSTARDFTVFLLLNFSKNCLFH